MRQISREQHIVLNLLKTALNGDASFNDYSCLVGLTAEQWKEVYSIALNQGVLALVGEVLDSIPKELLPPKQLILQWASNIDRIEQKNAHHIKASEELCQLWSDNGICSVVMKGISFGQYYPIPSHRQFGDFDCYLFGDYEKGNIIAEKAGATVNREWYKHSQIYFQGIMAENHQMLVTTRTNKSSKQLNQELIETIGYNPYCKVPGTTINAPSIDFSFKFQVYHSISHFVAEGISLRHLCDWYCLIKGNQDIIDWPNFYAFCNRYNFSRFAEAMTRLCVDYLDLSIINSNVQMSSQYSDKILLSILNDSSKSKVFSSGKGAWHNRLKLVYNIFKDGWKHRQIAGHSATIYFFQIVFGYILHNE